MRAGCSSTNRCLTIVRRPARGKTGWPERIKRKLAGKTAEPDTADLRALDAAATALIAALEAYGARAARHL